MIGENILILILTIFGMTILLFIAFWSFRLLFAYKVTNDSIKVLLFHHIPIYTIPFKKITAIRIAPLYKVALIPGMHFFTHPFARRVVIEVKDSWFNAFLTPKNPETFIIEVKSNIIK